MFKVFEKKYGETIGHQTSKIVCMLPNGKLCLIKKGKLELTNDYVAIPEKDFEKINIQFSMVNNRKTEYIDIYNINGYFITHEYSSVYESIDSFYLINNIHDYIESVKEIFPLRIETKISLQY